jgi:hypothetical protein
MTSSFAYVLAVLLVPVALSLMLFVTAFIERETPSAPQAAPVAPVGRSTPLVGIDGKTNSCVDTKAPSAA